MNTYRKSGFLFFIFFPLLMFAQKQANIWHFGSGHALDFSSGNPVQLSGSAMETFEGSASYCDALGNLLFYTNGGGREPLFSGQDAGHIWNRNNAVMYDMQGTQGGGFSAAQSSVIFEAPAQPGVFYVFTMDELEFSVGASPAITAAQPQGRGLRYFTVDMNLNAGLGGVVLADQPVYLPSFEGLCAIRHANQQDYWVLINQDSTGIGVYRVDASGVSFSGNYTAIGGGTYGIIKASPDGQRVKVGAYLLNFNNSTGTLSNPLNLGTSSEFFEFSPNSNFLYEAVNTTIFQYDLQAASIPASATAIGTINNSSGFGAGQMQLAPDGRIYFLSPDPSQNNVVMGRINCPNDVAASLQQGLFTFPGFFIGLPNFPAWIFENDDFTVVSLGADTLSLCDVSVGYTLDAQNPGATYLWSTGATTQQIFVGSPGTYSVTVLGPCGTGTDQVVITACSPPVTDCLVFEYTGAPQQWTVPPGVDSIRVQMWGAAGGGGPDFINNNGGSGGYTEVTLPVVAGDFLEIVVGGGGAAAQGHIGGAGGYAGGGDGGSGNRVETIGGVPTEVGGAGGGGGLTVVRMQGSITNILGMAGGGGGGALNRPGGAGGGLEAEYTVANNGSSLNGFGGTQTAGGAPSDNPFCPHPVSGTPGAGQQGGTGATDLSGFESTGGGGGGSGYFGGGGGGSQDACFGVGSPGGGGSGFVCNTCNGLYGFTETGGLSGNPPNSNDPIFQAYPQTATGAVNQNGGNGLVQICFLTGCVATADTIALSACSSFTDPLGNQYTQSGTYSYTLTASSGCDSTVVVNLTILPVLQTQLTITACDSFVAEDGAIYYQSTVLSDTLIASTGCDSVVTVQLTVNQSVLAPVQQVTACASYIAPWGVIYTQSGVYADTLLSAGGCDSIVVINLTISSVPALTITTASADSCEQSAVSFSLSPAQPVISVDWQFDDPGSGAQNISTALNPQHQFSAPGTYTVQSVVERDCGSDTLFAQLIVVACDDSQRNCALYVPNAFSPNGDGSNDRFSPEANCPYEVFSLQVFNRWGEQVFQTFNPGNGWDGTYRQEVCPVGVYVYTFRYRFANLQTNYLQGSVTLVR